jgi:hypothetical protein
MRSWRANPAEKTSSRWERTDEIKSPGIVRGFLLSGCADVRFGSLADVTTSQSNVRFTPNNGHCSARVARPLSATSGHLCCFIEFCMALPPAPRVMQHRALPQFYNLRNFRPLWSVA